jgi:hypothetical protein
VLLHPDVMLAQVEPTVPLVKYWSTGKLVEDPCTKANGKADLDVAV